MVANIDSSLELFFFNGTNRRCQPIRRLIETNLLFHVVFRFTKATHHVQQVKLFSKISVVCPNPVAITTELNQNPSLNHLYENMWIVDKQSFDSCVVNKTIQRNRLLLNCNKPSGLKYYSFVFHMVSPQTFLVEYEAGKSYYIICECVSLMFFLQIPFYIRISLLKN